MEMNTNEAHTFPMVPWLARNAYDPNLFLNDLHVLLNINSTYYERNHYCMAMNGIHKISWVWTGVFLIYFLSINPFARVFRLAFLFLVFRDILFAFFFSRIQKPLLPLQPVFASSAVINGHIFAYVFLQNDACSNCFFSRCLSCIEMIGLNATAFTWECFISCLRLYCGKWFTVNKMPLLMVVTLVREVLRVELVRLKWSANGHKYWQ